MDVQRSSKGQDRLRLIRALSRITSKRIQGSNLISKALSLLDEASTLFLTSIVSPMKVTITCT